MQNYKLKNIGRIYSNSQFVSLRILLITQKLAYCLLIKIFFQQISSLYGSVYEYVYNKTWVALTGIILNSS